jgi:ABC-type transport system involved in cytochrome c biogenesis permease subunit
VEILIINTIRAMRTLWTDPQFKSLTRLALIAITSGTVFYWLVEGLRPVDALYFSVTTLTTVGYGDFSPETDAGKLFTVVYVLVGVGILLAFLTRVAAQVVSTHMQDHEARNGHGLRPRIGRKLPSRKQL